MSRFDESRNRSSSLESLDSSCSSSSVSSSTCTSKRLQWGDVVVREYIRIPGDHPDVTDGPPISIGWEFNEHAPMEVDNYEDIRGPVRRDSLSSMTSSQRHYLLHNVFRVADKDIKAAEKKARKIRRRREDTLNETDDCCISMIRGPTKLSGYI